MTLTTETKREQTQQDDDEVSQVIEALSVILTIKEIERLRSCMQRVENITRDLVRSIPKSQLNQRDPRAVAAAAVYTALLQFRASTGVMVPIHRLEIAAGVTVGKIRGAWTKFFDRTVGLRRDRLELMNVNDTMELSDMIHEAVTHLQLGVEVTTPEITGWFNRMEGMALLLTRDLELPDDVHPEVAALAAIYEASYRLHGPRLVNITFGDAMEVCGYGGGLVSRTRIMLFPEGG